MTDGVTVEVGVGVCVAPLAVTEGVGVGVNDGVGEGEPENITELDEPKLPAGNNPLYLKLLNVTLPLSM